MTLRRGRASSALVIVVGVLALAGCVGAPRSDGPLRFVSDGPSRVCVPSPDDGAVAFGVNLPSNLPDGLVVEAVELLHPDGVTVGSVYAMPVTIDHRFMADAYPPVAQFSDAWVRSTPALDHELPEAEAVDLVLETRSSGTGSFDGVWVRYRADGREYVATWPEGLKVGSGACDV